MKTVKITGAYNLKKLGGDGTRRAAPRGEEEPGPEGQLRAIGAYALGQPDVYPAWALGRSIAAKVRSYASQDAKRREHLAAPDLCAEDAADLLVTSALKCNYCLDTVKVMYSAARDPKQWTTPECTIGRTS